MAIVIKRTVSLDALGQPEQARGTLYQQENLAHKFVIHGTRGGEAVPFTGSVMASFIRPDGETVPLDGYLEDGAAAVELPQACYAATGRFTLTVWVVENTAQAAVYCMTGNVKATKTGSMVDPEGVIPTTEQLADAYQDMLALTDDAHKYAKTADSDGSADLDVVDEAGDVILRLENGHVRTKNVNSASIRQFAGKKWTCIGDSLTEVNGRTTKHYHDYIAEKTGIEVVNLGHSGEGYYAVGSTRSFRTQVPNVPLDSDVVTIFGSGNDVGKKSLGNVTDTDANDTLCGYINKTLDLLYSRMPTVNLGVVTPTPWVNGNTDWTPSNPENAMELYCEAIVEICRRRSIPCLDLYHMSNLRPQDTAAKPLTYSKDDGNGVHPDEAGHLLIAGRFMAFLESLIM